MQASQIAMAIFNDDPASRNFRKPENRCVITVFASPDGGAEAFWRAIEELEAAEEAVPRPWQLPSK